MPNGNPAVIVFVLETLGKISSPFALEGKKIERQYKVRRENIIEIKVI
jgi:hypothetical protein